MQIPIPKYDVNLIIDAIWRHRPTYLPGVPTLFISLLNHADIRNCGLEYVRSFNSGAAPLPVEVPGRKVSSHQKHTQRTVAVTAAPTKMKRKSSLGRFGSY